ncbi:MAG: RNA methyltransferase [Planctomycetota bacterium]|jgi:tRNA G18 (ribose-2'-O)-methylase SpoU
MDRMEHPLYGMVENVRSLWNVGSIFRTSAAVGVRKLYLCGMTGHPPRPEISKTALGAEHVVPWEYTPDAAKAVVTLKDLGVNIVALETTEDALPLETFDFPFPLCLIVGHEVEGISRNVLALADSTIAIPMFGTKTSLNVAVAYGIAMYECLRRIR